MKKSIRKTINNFIIFSKICGIFLIISGGIILSTVTYSSQVLPIGPLKYISHTVDSNLSYPMHTLLTNKINHLSFWLNQNDEDKPLLDVGAMARDQFTLDIGVVSVNADGNKYQLHHEGYLFFNPNYNGLQPFLASDSVFLTNIGFDLNVMENNEEQSINLTVGDLFKAMFVIGDNNQQHNAAVLSLVNNFHIDSAQITAILRNSITIVKCRLSPFTYQDHYGVKGLIDEIYRLEVIVMAKSEDINLEGVSKPNSTYTEINTGATLVVAAPGCDIQRTEKRGWSVSAKKDGTILRANVSPRTKSGYRFNNEQIDIYALLQLWKMPVASFDDHRMMSGTIFDENDDHYGNNLGYVWAKNKNINKKYIKKISPTFSFAANEGAEDQQHIGEYAEPYLVINDIEIDELESYKDRVGLMSIERKLLIQIEKLIKDQENDEL